MGTTQIFDGKTWSLGPSIGQPLEQHCTVRLNSTHLLVTGGLLSLSPIVRFDAAILLDIRWVDVHSQYIEKRNTYLETKFVKL